MNDPFKILRKTLESAVYPIETQLNLSRPQMFFCMRVTTKSKNRVWIATKTEWSKVLYLFKPEEI